MSTTLYFIIVTIAFILWMIGLGIYAAWRNTNASGTWDRFRSMDWAFFTMVGAFFATVWFVSIPVGAISVFGIASYQYAMKYFKEHKEQNRESTK